VRKGKQLFLSLQEHADLSQFVLLTTSKDEQSTPKHSFCVLALGGTVPAQQLNMAAGWPPALQRAHSHEMLVG